MAGKKKLTSYNLLVGRYAGADGMKTGFVCASGFNMIGSATRDGRTLVAIVLGEKSRRRRAPTVAAKLLDQGFAKPQHRRSRPWPASRRYGDGAGVGSQHARRGLRQEAGKAAAKAEQPQRTGPDRSKSPCLEKLDHPPKLVAVGLGGATGTVPAAYAAAVAAGKAADVDGIADPDAAAELPATTASSATPDRGSRQGDGRRLEHDRRRNRSEG